MYCRPARRRLLRRKVVDLSLGGMRVYSDEPFERGDRMEIDLFVADDDNMITCLAEVVWVRSMDEGQPAGYDVGLQFLDVPQRGRAIIERLLSKGDGYDDA